MSNENEEELNFSSVQEELEYWKEKAIEYRQGWVKLIENKFVGLVDSVECVQIFGVLTWVIYAMTSEPVYRERIMKVEIGTIFNKDWVSV